MIIDTIWIGAIAAIAGSFVTMLGNTIIQIYTKRSEERKHRRELILKLAIESYKENLELAKFMREDQPGTPVHLMSLEQHLVRVHNLANLVLENRLNQAKLEKALSETYSLSDEITEIRQRYVIKNLDLSNNK